MRPPKLTVEYSISRGGSLEHYKAEVPVQPGLLLPSAATWIAIDRPWLVLTAYFLQGLTSPVFSAFMFNPLLYIAVLGHPFYVETSPT
jgi:hypothetical protein